MPNHLKLIAAALMCFACAKSGDDRNPEKAALEQGEIVNSGLWLALNFSNSPSARSGHSGIYVNDQMIIWGGEDLTGDLVNTGGVYDITDGSWREMPKTSAPKGRHLHSTVELAGQMIIFGGYVLDKETTTDSSGNSVTSSELKLTDTGSRFDPVSNRFLSLATTNAPDARHGHAAVACTFEMIVWGGYSAASSTVVNSGSRYDPLSDTWTAMSTTDAPSARMDHSAVWTGEKMLVWGGSSTTLENSGASYDPVADKWTPLSVTNAPTARKHHTAVFSSPYMIVWGGLGSDATGVVKLDSGGLYKVTDDTWTAINTVGAPIARFNHRAIVDKTKMVLWGGQGSEPLADGGIYDLTTNAWTLISAETKVKGRTLHSLVFTGTHLIVWGGFSSAGKYMDSGYAYKWP